MSFKEEFNQEKKELVQNKRPYETAAFILFGVLFFQQVFFLFRALIQFMQKGNNNFNPTNITTITNNQAFFGRIVFLDSSSWLYVILAVLALCLYYFLVYLFVWKYCRTRGLAKWTWTLLVVYAPSIFLAPAYIWYAIYVFRPYIFRFIKRGIEEFKDFNPKHKFKEEVEKVIEEEY